jgi:hypothetical protein
MYPEDSRILGGYWTEYEAELLIKDEIESSLRSYGKDRHSSQSWHYHIDEIEMPDIPQEILDMEQG